MQPAKPHYATKLVAEWAQQKEEAAALAEVQEKPPKVVGPSDLLTNPLVLLRPDGQVSCQLHHALCHLIHPLCMWNKWPRC